MKENKIKDITKAKELIKKFDPILITLAMQEIDIKAEDIEKAANGIKNIYESISETENKEKVLLEAIAVVNAEILKKEINKITNALKDFDKKVIVKAAKEYLELQGLSLYCDHVICRCPEGGCRGFMISCLHPEVCRKPIGPIGCHNPLDICRVKLWYENNLEYLDIDDLDYLGLSQLKALRILDANKRVSVVIRTGTKIGYAGLCVDSVHCPGEGITVMTKCLVAVHAFDINGTIDPVEALLKVAESSPILLKRVKKMVEEIKKTGEL